MTVFISALLAFLVITVIIYPFIKARFHPTSLAPDSLAQVGWGDREAIYEEIRALQLERELGSIDEPEYQEQLRAYRWQVAAALRDQERRQRGPGRKPEGQ